MFKIDDVYKIQSLIKAVTDHPDLPWKDAWSKGQLESKSWMLDQIANIQQSFDCVYVIGGWLGVLPWLMFNDSRFNVNVIKSFDIEPSCEQAADKLNIEKKMDAWKFKAVTEDAMNMRFSKEGVYEFVALKANGNFSKPKPEVPDCIINSSCDHFPDLQGWIQPLPSSSLLVLQNTNHAHDDTHVNCAESLEDFLKQASLTTVLYSGSLDMGFSKRFMIIGHK